MMLRSNAMSSRMTASLARQPCIRARLPSHRCIASARSICSSAAGPRSSSHHIRCHSTATPAAALESSNANSLKPEQVGQGRSSLPGSGSGWEANPTRNLLPLLTSCARVVACKYRANKQAQEQIQNKDAQSKQAAQEQIQNKDDTHVMLL